MPNNSMMWLIQIIMFGFMIYLIINMIQMSKRNGKNQRMLKVLDVFQDEEEFFKQADQNIENEKDPEFVEKTRVLRIWGDVRYEKDQDYEGDVEKLNLEHLVISKKAKVDPVALNEDSFFYLFLAIPNRLYYRNRLDLYTSLERKLDVYASQLDSTLVKSLSHACMMYYRKESDLGKAFYENLLNGDYGQYRYSKQLIGIYKSIASCFLARIALDENNQENFDEQVENLRYFARSPLGERYLMELDITLPKEEEELDQDETSNNDVNEETDDTKNADIIDAEIEEKESNQE